jgi:tricorn protease
VTAIMKKTLVLLISLFTLTSVASNLAQSPASSEARLLRFPAIHGNQIVFSYAGDLFTVSSTGGVARRLTSDAGNEMFPRFSPDGKWLAFTGQYDGNTEVYAMPAEGGIPRRLTITATLGRDDVSDRMGPNNIVMGWKDDSHILFRSRRIEWNDFRGQLYLASLNGGAPEMLPLPRGGFGSYSPDGTKLAYNRVFREFRTWKRYRGGQADDVWVYDFASKQTTNITGNEAQDIIPMWSGNRIYFLSDRDRRLNLFVYDLGTKQTRQLTRFTDYDCKFPSLGDRAIVFENGGYIYTFDLATEKTGKVPIVINEDFDSGRAVLTDVSRSITNYEVAPDGSRALFGARGDVFTVPLKNGPTRNLTRTPGVHDRGAKWSPDGRSIAYISDASGEDEIYLHPQDGKGAVVQITTGGDVYKYQPLWSPDSKKLMWSDRKQRLNYVDIDSRVITTVGSAAAFEITDYAWSPDSKWIAYARPETAEMIRVCLYGLETRQTHAVTNGWYPSQSPAFSRDGKYLFFVSDRTFSPSYGETEFEHIYQDMGRIYLVTLARDTKSPFEPKSDEVKVKEAAAVTRKDPAEPKAVAAKQDEKAAARPDSKPPAADAPAGGDAAPVVKVDVEGLESRIAVLPTPASGYRNLQSAGSRLYYVRQGARDAGPHLCLFDLDKAAETDLGTFGGFEISADGKKMLVSSERAYAILDLPTSRIEFKDPLSLADMKVTLDRHAEWRQIFNESWRQMRDFFWDPTMGGVDWVAVRKAYEPLVAHVNSRADLTYIIGEMISELNTGHAYVGGGDLRQAPRIPLGLLGAQIDRDPVSGYYRITRILKGENWTRDRRSPLTDIGVTARQGDYILAVDGKPTNQMADFYEALIDRAGKQVTLTVNGSPALAGSRDTVVLPIDSEQPLYYFNWIEENREKVSKATGGRVGYVHIPDMGPAGLNEFARQYYPQFAKEAVIVDVRSNGGGNVSPMIVERLLRRPAMFDMARNTSATTDPGGLIMGPKVALADEFSASDGDIFTYRFKYYKLGPVIGKRTWGGVVGIRGTLPLLDGGVLNRPEFSRYDVAGTSWVMEGHGVDPDIVVDNDPAREFGGADQQLDKAIEVILDLLKKNPANIPPPPPYPVKK